MFTLKKISEKMTVRVNFSAPLINKMPNNVRKDIDISDVYPVSEDPFYVPGVWEAEFKVFVMEACESYKDPEFVDFLETINSLTNGIRLMPASARILQAFAPQHEKLATSRYQSINAYGQFCSTREKPPWNKRYCTQCISLGTIMLTEWCVGGHTYGSALVVECTPS